MYTWIGETAVYTRYIVKLPIKHDDDEYCIAPMANCKRGKYVIFREKRTGRASEVIGYIQIWNELANELDVMFTAMAFMAGKL